MRVESTYKLPEGFKTSIDVLNEVLNMPCSTIEYELKKNNYPCYNSSSNCIDEKMLDIFAEKYCRNLKRYFERSVQNSESLSYEESVQIYEFAQMYSKSGHFTKNWRYIDKVAIKDDFFRQIVELTTRKKTISIEVSDSLKDAYVALLKSVICVTEKKTQQGYKADLSVLKRRIESVICSCDNECLRVFDASDSFLLNPYCTYYKYDLNEYLESHREIVSDNDSISESPYLKQQDNFHNRVILVEKIKHSRLYLSRSKRKCHTLKFVPLFQRIYACARFHIVSDDGTDDEMNKVNSLRA